MSPSNSRTKSDYSLLIQAEILIATVDLPTPPFVPRIDIAGISLQPLPLRLGAGICKRMGGALVTSLASLPAFPAIKLFSPQPHPRSMPLDYFLSAILFDCNKQSNATQKV